MYSKSLCLRLSERYRAYERGGIKADGQEKTAQRKSAICGSRDQFFEHNCAPQCLADP